MIVRDEISHEKILRTIEEPREPLLESVELFDLIHGASRSGAKVARISIDISGPKSHTDK